ncbi:LOW QUALITY PROTEIN: hypothetical protein V1478_004043 [Vespula squamosa]|uniref:Uncharacterized protein n=1 Tax=Vespula squamosa TaxID=30214 RepID=A0ABD2BNI7_VESSQ
MKRSVGRQDWIYGGMMFDGAIAWWYPGRRVRIVAEMEGDEESRMTKRGEKWVVPQEDSSKCPRREDSSHSPFYFASGAEINGYHGLLRMLTGHNGRFVLT